MMITEIRILFAEQEAAAHDLKNQQELVARCGSTSCRRDEKQVLGAMLHNKAYIDLACAFYDYAMTGRCDENAKQGFDPCITSQAFPND